MTKSRTFLFLMVAFILGVGSGSFFDISQEAVLVIAIAAIFVTALLYRRGSKILNFKMTFAVFLILFFSAGILRYDISESKTKVLTNFNDINENIELAGYINGESKRLTDKQRFILQVKEARVSEYAVFIDEKILITTGLYPEFRYGDLVSIRGKLRSPENFDDFDYINYLSKDGIFSLSYYPKISEIGQDYFLKPSEISFFEKTKLNFFSPIFRFKNAFKDSISRSVAEPNAAFINGILLGSRENIPQDLKEAFNKTGTTHILAISGYNITIVGLYVSSLLTFFMRRQKAFWITVLAIILFTILTGASASVVRASIMGILVLLVYREGRFYSMINSIVFAGAAMVALNPKILRFDVGFQLSFLATLGLIYIAPLLKEKLKKIPEFWNFKENFAATLSAQLAVLPVILYNFGNFSILSLPANVLILPAVPITMFFGFLSGASGLALPGLGEFLGLFAWFTAEYEILVVKMFSSIL